MNSLEQYNKISHLLRPGDVVVFRDFWLNSPLSAAIELLDPTESHSAIIRQPVIGSIDATIVESTRPVILSKTSHNGVQTNPLGATLAGYGPNSSAACLRLSAPSRAKIDWFKFYSFIGQCDGFVKYDVAGLFDFLLREVPILGTRVAQDENQTAMVCSAWVCALLIKCGVLEGMNWSKVSPQDLIEIGIYEKDSIPLLGSPKLVRFNSLQ